MAEVWRSLKEVVRSLEIREVSLYLNMACLLLELEEYGETREILRELLSYTEETGQEGPMGIIYATMLPCHAVEEEWDRWDESMTLANGYLRDKTMAEVDLAWTFERAGSLAKEAGQAERARDAYRWAKGLWREVGDADKIAEMEAAIEELVDR